MKKPSILKSQIYVHVKLALITFLPWKPKQLKNAQMYTNVLIVDMSTLIDE